MAFDLKVCGMGSAENAAAISAIEGVSVVGFIHHPSSPRHRSGADMIDMRAALAEGVQTALVVVDQPIKVYVPLTYTSGASILQFHGNEAPEECAQQRQAYKVWKTVHLGPDWDPAKLEPYYDSVDRFLFDTRSPLPGGSGQRFDWSLLKAYSGPVPFVLAGGIGPEHVNDLLSFKHDQWVGIDINSRFETAPGAKDVEKVRAFAEALKPLLS